jgi:hypothetical protein
MTTSHKICTPLIERLSDYLVQYSAKLRSSPTTFFLSIAGPFEKKLFPIGGSRFENIDTQIYTFVIFISPRISI